MFALELKSNPMNFLEARETRRSLLVKTAVFGSAFLLEKGCGFQNPPPPTNNIEGTPTNSPEPPLTNNKIIEANNIPQLEEILKNKVKNFPLIPIGSAIQNLDPSIGRYGIENFVVGKNIQNDNLTFNLQFNPGAKAGSLYQSGNMPKPLFIFVEDDSKIPDIEALFGFFPTKEQTRYFMAEFNLPISSLTGKSFSIHLNAKLITLNGRERPAFTIPYRFILPHFSS